VVDGTKILLESGVSEPFDSSIWSGLADEGQFTIIFYANDSAGNINNIYSLTLYKDVVMPSLSIDLPANNTYWNSIPDVQITASDTYFDSVWYVADGTKILLESGVSEPFDSTIWSGLPNEGQFIINFYANDSAGNVNNTYTLTLYKDVITPTLSIDSPTNNTYWNVIFDIQVTVSDTYFDSVWYVADGTKILLESGVSEPFDSSIWSRLSDEGLFTINFFANDSAGNVNNTYSLTLYKDVVTPTLSINLPTNNTYWNAIFDIQITVLDTYFDSVWYVADGTKILLENGVSEPFDSSIWSELSDEGQFIINFYANDSAGNVNNTYSLTLYKDVITPTLSIDLPANNTFWNSAPNIQVTASDTYFDSVWYVVDGTKILLESGVSEPLDSSIWSGLADEGQFIINFYANDSAGNINNTYTLTLYKDVVTPTLTINSPANNTYWNSVPDVQATASDTYFDSVWYVVDGTKILLESGVSEPLDTSIWSSLLDEAQFTINFYANDSAGNINNTYSLTLYKDVVTPSLTIDSPANNTYWNTIFDIQITASDTYFDSVWYVADGTKILLESGVSEPFDSSIWSGLSDEGLFTINFFANDSAGNVNNTYTLTLYKDVITPTLSITSPADNTYWNVIPNIQITTSDTYFDSVWYTIGATKILLDSGVSEPLDSSIWSDLPDEGQFTINFFANDSAGNVNNTYTLTLYKDIIAPRLIINYPLNQTSYNTPPPINITVYEPNLAFLKYTVINYFPTDNWLNDKNNTEVPLNPDIWDDLTQGAFQIEFTCFDDLGQSTILTITLYKDTNAPSITINSPVNNTFWNSIPSLNITAIDPNLDTIWYRVGISNITLSSGIEELLIGSIWNDLAEGPFNIEIFANDTFGHINNSYVLTLHKDLTTPSLTIILPNNGTIYDSPPSINATVFDSYFDSLWYKVGNTNITLYNNTKVFLNLTIWDSLLEEEVFFIYFYANDSAGNLNNTLVLTLYKDVKAPTIIIDSPQSSDLFGENSPSVSLDVQDANLDNVWYQLSNGTVTTINYTWTGSISQAVWNQVGNGTVTIRFYANDTLNHLGDEEVTIRKNIFDPIITITNPGNNALFGIGAPNITLYKAGIELDTTWYTIDYGETNYTFSGSSVVINQTAWDDYGFEDVTITFYINDSLGKIGSDTITIRKDPDSPEITIFFINPSTNNTYWDIEPTFRVSVYEPNNHSIWYRVGMINVFISNNTDITLQSAIWDNLPQGIFTIEIFANDTLGYMNDTITLTFKKDTLAPQLIINQPNDFTFYNSRPPINITIFDPNSGTPDCTYTVSGYSPIWLENNTESLLDQAIWGDLADGEFFVYITAYDIFGHVNNSIILTLYKDTTEPVFETVSPNNSTCHNTHPLLKISYLDSNPVTIWYRVGSTNITISNNTAIFLNDTIWSGLSEGLFTIEFYANDTFGYLSNSVNLTLIKDTTLPLITVNSPANSIYYSDPPLMNIIMSDLNPDTIWYTVSSTKVLLSGVENFSLSLWNSLDQGEFQVNIFANDSAGNLNDSIILTLYKDTIAPLVTVNLPLNNTYWNIRPTINVEAYDPNLDGISWSAAGYSGNLTSGDDLPLPFGPWLNLTDGPFILEIFATDIFGHINDSIKITLYKDITPPNIDIISPQPNDIFGENTPFVDLDVTDTNLEEIWYHLSNGTVVTNNYPWTGSIEQVVWDQVGNGTVTIRFFANDTATNINNEDVVVIKNLYAPIININSPYDNELFGINSPNFDVYTSGTDSGTNTWYMLIGRSVNYTFSNNTGVIDQDAWSNFGYEMVTIRFYINNSLGKIGTDEVIVRKDPTMPTILVNSPINQTAFASMPFINLTIIEPNLDKVWYRINDYLIDITDNISQFIDFFIWDSLPQGDFNIELFANDTLGNVNNFNTLYLSKDTIGPNITIILPTESQKVDRNAPYFELSIFDENGVDSCWYTIDLGETTPFTGLIGRIDPNLWEQIWDNLAQGAIITIRFYAMDTLGNEGYTELTLIVEKPVELPKFLSNLPSLVLSTLGLVAMVPFTLKLIKTRYYKSLNNKDKKKLRNALIAAGFFLSLLTLYFIL